MSNLQGQMQELKAIRAEATAIMARAASENREGTKAEQEAYNVKAGRALYLESQIAETQGKNTLISNIGGDFTKLVSESRPNPDASASVRPVRVLSHDYREAFTEYMAATGPN